MMTQIEMVWLRARVECKKGGRREQNGRSTRKTILFKLDFSNWKNCTIRRMNKLNGPIDSQHFHI